MSLTITSWNVNSLRARSDGVLAWLADRQPGIACLQETRLPEKEFPYAALARLGYQAVHHGLARYAGVAIVARETPVDAVAGFTDFEDEASPRLVRATVGALRVVNVYVPTRKAIGKVEWLERLRQNLLDAEDLDAPLILCGDFNICFDPRDAWRVDVLSESERFPDRVEDRAFRRLLKDCGLVDLFRLHHDQPGEYSWFDYRRHAFQRRHGLRLDYLFATRPAADLCLDAWHDYAARGVEKPSDHVPVSARLDLD